MVFILFERCLEYRHFVSGVPTLLALSGVQTLWKHWSYGNKLQNDVTCTTNGIVLTGKLIGHYIYVGYFSFPDKNVHRVYAMYHNQEGT